MSAKRRDTKRLRHDFILNDNFGALRNQRAGLPNGLIVGISMVLIICIGLEPYINWYECLRLDIYPTIPFPIPSKFRIFTAYASFHHLRSF